MFGFFKRRRRKKLKAAPFPPAWLAIMEQNIPLYRRLVAEDQEELRGHVQVFLGEKQFVGCQGLEITDEIRITIAAQACLLLLHRKTDYYPSLGTIFVYPSAYVGQHVEQIGPGVVNVTDQVRAGESWMHGMVALSWDHTRHGAADVRDGSNVVLHEFAHQLDHEDGALDGAPVLSHSSRYVVWARVLSGEYRKLHRARRRRRRTVLDKYGATNPAEFFAVATECFFEKAVVMKRKHPELYEELKKFYRQDPGVTALS